MLETRKTLKRQLEAEKIGHGITARTLVEAGQEVEEAQEALRKWARHKDGCKGHKIIDGKPTSCGCGLYDDPAIKAAYEEEEDG